MHWTITGTHEGELEGLAATGKQVSADGDRAKRSHYRPRLISLPDWGRN
ncbi:MAG: hypothetical protein JSU96_14985 [Acidobacteriota bacterium]|nr:MAG: hypothetical protein JSU96_14985 [Acidobacteriota bacterium]